MTMPLDAMRAELDAAVAGAAPGRPAADELCLTSMSLLGVEGVAVSMIHEGSSRGTFGSSNETSRRLDEYQFTFGEGPCLDAVATRKPVLAPDLDSPYEQRWPVFAGAVLNDGIRGVFAIPIMVSRSASARWTCFAEGPGPSIPTSSREPGWPRVSPR